MAKSAIKQTTAYKIIREMVDHSWDSDTPLEKEEIVAICKHFNARGGSWEAFLDGDVNQFTLLEQLINKHIQNRIDPNKLNLDDVAFNIMLNMF